MSVIERAGSRALFRASEDVSLERVVAQLVMRSEELDADEFEVQFHEEADAIGLEMNPDLTVRSCVPGSVADLSELIEPGLSISAVQGLSTTGLSNSNLDLLLTHSIRPISIRFKGSRKAAANANKFIAGRTVQVIDVEVTTPAISIDLNGDEASGCHWRFDLRGILIAAAVTAEASKLTISERLNALNSLALRLVVCGMHASFDQATRTVELLSSYSENAAEMPSIRVNYPRTFSSFNEWALHVFQGAPLTHRLSAGALPLIEMDLRLDEASQKQPKLKVVGNAGTLVVNADIRALPGLLEISQFTEPFNTDRAVADFSTLSTEATEPVELQQWELELDYTIHPLCLRMGTGETGSATLELALGTVYLRSRDGAGVNCIATLDTVEATVLQRPIQVLFSSLTSDEDERFIDARSSSEDGRTVLVQVNSPVFLLQLQPSKLSLGLTLAGLSFELTDEKVTAVSIVTTELQQAIAKIFDSTSTGSEERVRNENVDILTAEAFTQKVHQAVEAVLGVPVDTSETLAVYEVDTSSWATVLERVFLLDPFKARVSPELPELSYAALSCKTLAQRCYEMIYGLSFDLENSERASSRTQFQDSASVSLRGREEVLMMTKKLGEIKKFLQPRPVESRGMLLAVDIRILDAEVGVFDALAVELVDSSVRCEMDAIASSASLTVASFRLDTRRTGVPILCKLNPGSTTPRTALQPMLQLRVHYGETLPPPAGLVKSIALELASKEQDILEGYIRQNPRKRASRKLNKARRHFEDHLKLGGALAELDAAHVREPPKTKGPTGIKLGLASSMLSEHAKVTSLAPGMRDALDKTEVIFALRSVRLACTHSGNLAVKEALQALSGDGVGNEPDEGSEQSGSDSTASLAMGETMPLVLAETRLGVTLNNVEITCELEQGSKQQVVLGLGLEAAYIGRQLTEQAALSVSDLCVSTREPGVTTRSLVKPWSGNVDYALARSDPLDWTNLVRRTSIKLESVAVELWTSDVELLSTLSDTLSLEAELFSEPIVEPPEVMSATVSVEDKDEAVTGKSLWSLVTGNGVILADTARAAKVFLVFDWLLPLTGLSDVKGAAVSSSDSSESGEQADSIREWMDASLERVAETSIHCVSLGRVASEAHDRIEVLMKNIELRVVKGILVAYTSGTFLPVVKLRCYDALVRAESSSLFVEDVLMVARMSMEARFYNLRLETWEPLIEPTNDLVLSVYKGPLAKAVNIDVTSLQRINLNLSEDALSLYLSMSRDFTGLSNDRPHRSGEFMNNLVVDHSRQNTNGHLDTTPDYVLINQTGEPLELVDLFQIGCNRRGSLVVRAIDGWALPSRIRWGRIPELKFRLEPWGVSYHATGEEDCMIDYPGVIQNGFPSLKLLLAQDNVDDKENTRMLHGAIDLVPFVLMPGQHRKEWFSLCEEDGTSVPTAEILLSLCFHATKEDIPVGTTAIDSMTVQCGKSAGVSFNSVSNERWFEETKPKQIIQHLASTGITTVRKAEVAFALRPGSGLSMSKPKPDNRRDGAVLQRVFVPLDTTGKFIISGTKGFMLPITVGFRDDQRKTIVLQSPVVVKNNTHVDIELRICPPLQKST